MSGRARTRFDPRVHGYGFVNRFSGSDVLGELSRQHLIDDLFGSTLGGPVNAALAVASRAEFWGAFGLCGGMSWSALDNYDAGVGSTRDSHRPGPGDELFSMLVRRQAESFRGTRLVARLIAWSALPESNRWWSFWSDSVGKLVIDREWPSLKHALDSGRPQSLCLVRSRRLDGLSENHQVVAIGYVSEPNGHVTISLYDPNHPDDEPTISFDTSSFLHELDISQSTGEPIVGWFEWPR